MADVRQPDVLRLTFHILTRRHAPPMRLEKSSLAAPALVGNRAMFDRAARYLRSALTLP
jgi:hypothetical protein